MPKLQRFKIDEQKERTGVPVLFPLDTGYIRLYVRRADNNRDFERRVQELRRPFLRRIRTGKISQGELNRLTATAMAGTVLVGWDKDGEYGMEDEGGPVPFSIEKAVELLTDSSIPEFFRFVDAESVNPENFAECVPAEEEAALQEDSAKN